MPNLVGTGLNQVPINGMLGGLAYQDPEHASIKNLDLKNLSQINSEIADTAVDVFVYDTRKDSDGGAWRKRTQHTSWYNETLGTATRGSRREFPVVAVLVLESGGSTEGVDIDYTIYDGDDPDMPMWMQYRFKIGAGSNTAISALNGIITFCATDNGILISDFVKDRMTIHNHYHRHGYRFISPSRLGRSSVALYVEASTTGYSIVSQNCKDVAMTVLPNAPIDIATGLPIPTIAVSTSGGVSVIKDDGNIQSVSHSYGGGMRIDVDGDVLLATHNGPTSGQAAETFNLTTLTQLGDGGSGPVHGDNSLSTDKTYYGYGNPAYLGGATHMPFLTPSHGVTVNPIVKGNDIFFGGSLLIHIEEDRSSPINGMSNYITSDYNTGWMHGDVNGAFLSDTDDTNKTNGQTDPDRSAANLPLTVTGTVTKTPVATGADLVAYSGFSNSTNYMDNTSYSINFGNPPTISIMFWQKITDIADYSYGVSFSAGNTIKGGMSNGASSAPYAGQSYFFMGSETLFTGVVTDDGNWHCLVGTISGNAKKFYLDGREVASATINNHDMSGISRIHVGSYGTTHVYAHRGSLALLRVSKSVPSAEQIKKMYEEEKVLFQENAKATLYGSSDAVTALAFDDTTDLLHAGTSGGRSTFSGLKRIENTTTAVTTAISASNGLVAEQ